MAEKQSFSQRCSMLSQYLKENGSFGDLSLGMSRSVEPNVNSDMLRQTATPLNFFPVVEKNPMNHSDLKFMNLFPQPPELPKMADYRNKAIIDQGEPQRAQMTIFYDGKVIVLNDFPADKAKEVMLLATQECYRNKPKKIITNNANANTNAFPVHVAKSPIESSGSVPQSPTIVPKSANISVQETAQPAASRPIICDLPIARKASLHRFLEKRKDRINAKAPYQTNGPETAPAKQTENMSWLGLAAQSTH